MRFGCHLAVSTIIILVGGVVGACGEEENPAPARKLPDPTTEQEKPPGGELPDEQFPANLLEPYTGPPIDVYDNSTLTYRQLRARVDRVFADQGLAGNTDAFFSSKIGLLGGADFKTTFGEARVATPDFLLGLDGVSKEACARASTNKTGPFAGSAPDTVTGAGEGALVTQLYQRILFRDATPDEITAGVGLVTTLIPLSTSKTQAWAGMCEALVRHPDSIFTLPPSVATTTGAEKEKLQLVKISNDFAGRPPSDQEMQSLAGKTTAEKLDYYFGTPEFREFYFHRARLRTESNGAVETDEPARLWAHIVTSDKPMQELLTAEYSVDEGFAQVGRSGVHGKTGLLTMPGFIKSKPGLPHYNYAARVMSDFMGQLFEVTPEVVASRLVAAESTVDPNSTCIACHGVLTPLANQRLAWGDDGYYRTVDPETGKPIDDTDKDLVPSYPYKGKGMEGFAVKAVKKERFFRQTFQSQFLFFMGRPMRYDLDERTVYLALWNTAWKQNGNFKALLKVIAEVPTYLAGKK